MFCSRKIVYLGSPAPSLRKKDWIPARWAQKPSYKWSEITLMALQLLGNWGAFTPESEKWSYGPLLITGRGPMLSETLVDTTAREKEELRFHSKWNISLAGSQ